MIIDELVGLLTWKSAGEADLKRFQQGMRNTIDMMQRMATVAAAAGAVLATAMVAVGKSVIDTSAKFEGFQTSLETIEGSSAKAKASMDWISNFAKSTPYELDGITEAFIKLKSYGIDPVDGTLTTLGDTASAMNKPLDSAVEAFADAATFQFERLKSFGITSSQEGDKVVFTWTKNGKQVSKTLKKNGEDIRKFLLQNFGERFGGSMNRQAKTWNGMMSNLGDAWDNFKRRIGDSGFFSYAKGRLEALMGYIDQLDKDGTLDGWATWISDGLIAGAKAAEKAMIGLVNVFRQVRDFFSGDGTFFENIKAKLDSIDWSSVGETVGKGLVEGVKAASVTIFETMRDIDWKAVVKAWIGALKAQVEFIKGVFDGVGESIGNSIADGLKAVGGEIRAWFESVLPEWAKEFFAFRAEQMNALNSKAKDATDRRQAFERNAPTKPANQNTPGIADRMADMARQDRFRNWGNMAENARINTMRANGGGLSAASINAPTSVNINMPVQMIDGAANAAGNTVREAVQSKLSSISKTPARKVMSPWSR